MVLEVPGVSDSIVRDDTGGITGVDIPGIGLVGIDVLDSIWPYIQTILPISPTDKAAIDAGLKQAKISAGATRAAAAASAGAARFAATQGLKGDIFRSQATVDAQLIAARGQLQAIRDQIQGDLQRALLGEQGAAERLQAELTMAATIARNAQRLELAAMASKTGLMDAVQARLFAGGFGPQPAFGSALSLGSPLEDITAPTVPVPSAVPSVPALPSAGPLVAPDYLSQLGSLSSGASGGTIRPAPAPPAAPAGMFTGGIMVPAGGGFGGQYLADFQNRLGGGAPVRGFAGGTPGAGVAHLIGEKGPEVLVERPDGQVEVIPLVGGFQTGGLLGGGYSGVPTGGTSVVQGGGYGGFGPAAPAPVRHPAPTTGSFSPSAWPAPVRPPRPQLNPSATAFLPTAPTVTAPTTVTPTTGGFGSAAPTVAIQPTPGLQAPPPAPPAVAPPTAVTPAGAPILTGMDQIRDLIANDPALKAIQTGDRLNPLPNIQGPIYALGIDTMPVLPNPVTIAADYYALPSQQDRDDIIALYAASGIDPSRFLSMIAASTPGLRVPQTSFRFV